jgi:hypothetical protein
MTPAAMLRLGAQTLCLAFGGLGVFMLHLSFYNGQLASYALLWLAVATVLAWALGRFK